MQYSNALLHLNSILLTLLFFGVFEVQGILLYISKKHALEMSKRTMYYTNNEL